jgi:hypothetical protein
MEASDARSGWLFYDAPHVVARQASEPPRPGSVGSRGQQINRQARAFGTRLRRRIQRQVRHQGIVATTSVAEIVAIKTAEICVDSPTVGGLSPRSGGS